MIKNRQTLSEAPLSSPITEKGHALSEPFRQYFTKLSAFGADAHKVQTIASNEDSSQTCKAVRMGAAIMYSYTGLGGVTFTIRGNSVSIPAMKESATISNFIFAGE